MKYLLMALFLIGCGSSGGDTKSEHGAIEPEEDVYIVAGQSNARMCDWSYFTNLTGSRLVMLPIDGRGIEYLIDALPSQSHLMDDSAKAILFVHGETDATIGNTNYIGQVEEYRLLLGDLPLLISNVGYYSDWRKPDYPDELFDMITGLVNSEISKNDKWVLAFDDAKKFAEWGMLVDDGVHFTEDGCMMMMDAMVEATYNLE